jgi:hypothetical protein
MMKLQERLAVQIAPSPRGELTDWIAAWPTVRSEFEALIAAHARVRPDFHPQWTSSLIEALDTRLHELAHRTIWLKEQVVQLEEVR